MTAFVNLNGHQVQSVELSIPQIGVWFADVRLMKSPDISGKATLKIGETSLVGTISRQSGKYGEQATLRLLGGGGGWGKLLPVVHYHNDAGVRASVVAEDAARLCGETLGATAYPSERLGRDFTRSSGPGSYVMDYVSQGSQWWVAYDGATRIGERGQVASGLHEVLKYDPISQVAEVAVSDFSAVQIGSTLSTFLDETLVVRAIEASISGETFRLRCWCGGTSASSDRQRRAMEAIVSKLTGASLFGVYSYRVFSMSDTRVDLQATDKGLGLPDLLPVSMMPGASGWHADLAKGAEVLVQFVNGDRNRPVVTGFPSKGEGGHAPISVSICDGTLPLARQGDMVLSGGATTLVTFAGANPMVPGTPYTMQFTTPTNPIPTPYLAGVVASGNARVKA